MLTGIASQLNEVGTGRHGSALAIEPVPDE